MKKVPLSKLLIFSFINIFIFAALQSHAKPATQATRTANQAVLQSLPFNDKQDFEDAKRGFLTRPESLTIIADDGHVVWDMEDYKQYISNEMPAPDTVNPSLWRNAQLNMEYGLFEVTNGIYQVRGYDIANISFIRSQHGWIVFDVGSSKETAKAAYDLISEYFGEQLPIVAIVYSHSHADHYGGVKGLISEEDAVSGEVKVIAPAGFMEHAVSEGVIAGNAMSRRAVFMYGALLPRDAEGSVNAGLGQTLTIGEITLIEPNVLINETGETLNVDGIEMVFQMTPGTEAPAEMNIYLPQFKAMWMAENTTNTMHNILTLRGAQVRDALAWSNYINETIELYGPDIDVKFQSHHWPMWENARIIDYLQKQRDLYKFIHDRTVYLMNQGYVGEEIAEMIELPESLESFWPGRGYYGSLRHNARAVYQRYMGWYDANPSNLNILTPVDAGKKYVEYMGGEAAIMQRAQVDFDKGEYRWVAMILRHLVFANPENQAAKELLADTYEQLGYQAESGPWRSVYLQGAYELRNGVPDFPATNTASADSIRAMEPELLFSYLGVLLNADKAEGQTFSININFTDFDKNYTLSVDNSVLNATDKQISNPDASITLSRVALSDILLGQATIQDKVNAGEIELTGNTATLQNFIGMLDTYDFWFNIVTP